MHDYNRRIATEVYKARCTLGDPLSPRFEPGILDGPMGFGMGRTIGVIRSVITSHYDCLALPGTRTVANAFRELQEAPGGLPH
jgi:hypothetical protein